MNHNNLGHDDGISSTNYLPLRQATISSSSSSNHTQIRRSLPPSNTLPTNHRRVSVPSPSIGGSTLNKNGSTSVLRRRSSLVPVTVTETPQILARRLRRATLATMTKTGSLSLSDPLGRGIVPSRMSSLSLSTPRTLARRLRAKMESASSSFGTTTDHLENRLGGNGNERGGDDNLLRKLRAARRRTSEGNILAYEGDEGESSLVGRRERRIENSRRNTVTDEEGSGGTEQTVVEPFGPPPPGPTNERGRRLFRRRIEFNVDDDTNQSEDEVDKFSPSPVKSKGGNMAGSEKGEGRFFRRRTLMDDDDPISSKDDNINDDIEEEEREREITCNENKYDDNQEEDKNDEKEEECDDGDNDDDEELEVEEGYDDDYDDDDEAKFEKEEESGLKGINNPIPSRRREVQKQKHDKRNSRNNADRGANSNHDNLLIHYHHQQHQSKKKEDNELLQSVLNGKPLTKDYLDMAREHRLTECYRIALSTSPTSYYSTTPKVLCVICGIASAVETRVPVLRHEMNSVHRRSSIAAVAPEAHSRKMTKVFFPCRHRCICDVCFHRDGATAAPWRRCPLCHEDVRLVLDYKWGEELEEYEDWVNGGPGSEALLPEGWTKRWREESRKRIAVALSRGCACRMEERDNSTHVAARGGGEESLIKSSCGVCVIS